MTEATIKYNSKAVRLTEQLRSDIREGKYPAAQPLPTEEELSSFYEVARGTMHRCLRSLCDSGVISRDRRKNLWVAVDDGVSPGPSAGEELCRIGVLLGGSLDQMYFLSMAGIQDFCDRNRLYCEKLQYSDYAGALEILRHIDDYDIDGLIVLPFLAAEYIARLDELNRRGFPIVAIDHNAGLPLPLVESDHAGGTYQATRSLLERYRRPVYFFFSAIRETESASYEGYRRAMIESGFAERLAEHTLEFPYSGSKVALFDLNCSQQCYFALEWLPTIELPVSIVCANDYGAWGVYEAARQLQIPVGEQIKLWGLGDLPLCRNLTPELSSIRQPHEKVGFEAARLLRRIIDRRPAAPIHKLLPVTLVERQSSR